MDLQTAFLFFLSVIYFGVALGIIQASKLHKRNILFAAFIILLDFWILSALLTHLYLFNDVRALFFTKLAFLFSLSALSVLLLFFKELAFNSNVWNLIDIAILIPNVFISYPLVFTNTIVNKIHYISGSQTYTFNNSIFILLILVIIYLGMLIVYFIKSYFNSKGIYFLQLRYILLGTLLSIGTAILFGVLFPLIGLGFLEVFTPFSTLFIVIFTGYAIIKHRFLGIKVIFGQIFFYLILVSFVNLCFFSTLFIENRFIHSYFSNDAYLIDFPISIIFTLFFVFLDKKASFLANLYTGIEQQNRFISEIREITIDSLELTASLDKVLKYIEDEIKVEDIYFYAVLGQDYYIHSGDGEFYSFIKNNIKSFNDIKETDHLYITLEEKDKENYTFPYEEYTKYNIALSMLVEIDKESRVIFFLQTKNLEDKVFDVNEIQFLIEVFKQAALFINRGLLHQKVIDFNKTLQHRVEVATATLQEKNSELQKAYNEANEMARKERDMLDIMGHELRTPATVIKLAAYLLDNQNMDEKGKKQLARIKESIERQIKLINTFIDTAKMDNNKIDLSLSPVRIDEMVKQAVEDHMHDATEKNLALSYIDNGPMPLVLADPIRIREVIDNFISNAIKYTYTGFVKAYCKINENKLIVSVQDSGEGIKPDDQKELFQKFRRVNNYTSSSDDKNVKMIRPGGTGLGLYVSKGIIELHHGDVIVESEYGKGSTFSFSLPIPTEEELRNSTDSKASTEANLFSRLGRS